MEYPELLALAAELNSKSIAATVGDLDIPYEDGLMLCWVLLDFAVAQTITGMIERPDFTTIQQNAPDGRSWRMLTLASSASGDDTAAVSIAVSHANGRVAIRAYLENVVLLSAIADHAMHYTCTTPLLPPQDCSRAQMMAMLHAAVTPALTEFELPEDANDWNLPE